MPTAANAGYYARIVRERAILRRLVEAGTRIVQFGYAGDADADDLVDRAQAEVYAVTDRRISEDYHSLSEIMPGALDEIEAIGSRGGVLTGVPTGFADLDALTNGLHPGQMIVIAARPAVGKALALDTPLPTPTGWTTMGEVRVGDQLIGADGKPTRVVAATEVMHGRPCYEVEFDDGEVIVADENHQWLTWNSPAHWRLGLVPPRVVTTGAIARTLRREHRVAPIQPRGRPFGLGRAVALRPCWLPPRRRLAPVPRRAPRTVAVHRGRAARALAAGPVRAGGQPGPSVPGRARHDPDAQFDAGAGLRAGGRHQAQHERRCCSAWRWGGTRSRCGCCRPRRGCRCTRCAPGR